MKQFLIDISNEAAPNTQGRPTIIFYKYNTWDAACQLEMGSDHHEGHFGCYLGTLSGEDKGALAVDTVEHAKQIINALELAIQEGWLFTEAQIKKYKDRTTDTRRTLKQKIQSATGEPK